VRPVTDKYGVHKSTLYGQITSIAMSCKRGINTLSQHDRKELALHLQSASMEGFPVASTDVRRAAFLYAEM
jgi:hypothetical protein